VVVAVVIVIVISVTVKHHLRCVPALYSRSPIGVTLFPDNVCVFGKVLPLCLQRVRFLFGKKVPFRCKKKFD
jgi:hypothetical protein